MTIPIQVGWPQVLIFIVGIIGLGLLISTAIGMSGRYRGRYREDEEEERKFGRRRYFRHRRHFRSWRGISGVVLLLVAISLLWLTFLVQSYLGLTAEIKVAHIRATSLTNVAHEMSVELTLYDSNGHATSDKTYLLQGDEWMLQGDIIKFPAWLNVVGLHSGYKLTRLEGRYDNINLENSAQHTAIELNGGDDNFFKTMNAQKARFSWFVDASYGNAVFQAPGAFDVFATQDALIARPTG
ncbi:MAG: hypothetical protein NVSMB27_02870 [Ktedonobacteraceae bacterium]